MLSRIAVVGPALLLVCPALAAYNEIQPTFNRDVAPIRYEKCACCDSPGEVALFPLLTYGGAANGVAPIGTVTGSRTMPRWKPIPGPVPFLTEGRLGDQQIVSLRKWTEAGSSESEQAGKPPAPLFVDEWQFGEPDELYSLLATVQIPLVHIAGGNFDWQGFYYYSHPIRLPRPMETKLSYFSTPVQITSSILTETLVAALAFRRLMRRPPPHLQNGCWRTQPDRPLGAGLLKLYKRATTAAHGPFALSPQEAIYFIAAVDSAGKELDCGSTYCIHGCDPDTRWWSLTVYKRDHLIPNALNRYSFSKTTVARSADGSWKIYLSPRHQPQNWLPSGEPSGRPTLLLRLYNPGLAVVSGPETAQLPAILKLEKVS